MLEDKRLNRIVGTVLSEAELQKRHLRFLAAATSENTRRTYRSAVRHFQSWGGMLPCEPLMVIHYWLHFVEDLNSH
jgi:hypothetical protein